MSTVQDKLSTLSGVRGALESSIKWMKMDFPDPEYGYEELSVDAILNPLNSALQATINLEEKMMTKLKRDGGTE